MSKRRFISALIFSVSTIASARFPATAYELRCLASGKQKSVMIPSDQYSFGNYQNYHPLPLQRGEYILTFDDGPSFATTEKVVSLLAERNIHATFFVIGRNVLKSPRIVDVVANMGHTIGSHSYSHRNLTAIPIEEALSDIFLGLASIQEVLGSQSKTRRLFRFPEGRANSSLIAALREQNIVVAGYDLSPEDWRGDPPAVTLERMQKLLNRVDRGVIVLHDNRTTTVSFLPLLFEELEKRGACIAHLQLDEEKMNDQ